MLLFVGKKNKLLKLPTENGQLSRHMLFRLISLHLPDHENRNKQDKKMTVTNTPQTQSDILSVIKHEKQYAKWQLHVWWQARNPKGVTLSKHGLIIFTQSHCNLASY